MYILSAVELRRTAGTNTICSQSLYSFLFDLIISDEIVEIVGREIRNCSTVGEFGFWAGWSAITLAHV